jgi:hypothetical protein
MSSATVNIYEPRVMIKIPPDDEIDLVLDTTENSTDDEDELSTYDSSSNNSSVFTEKLKKHQGLMRRIMNSCCNIQ